MSKKFSFSIHEWMVDKKLYNETWYYYLISKVLIEHNAMVNRLMGDQVIALFVPRFAES